MNNLFSKESMLEASKTELDITEENKKYLSKTTLNQLENSFNKSNSKREDKIIYPAKNKVLNFLKKDLSSYKVVIIGQDPYPNENANGIAFSCDVKLSKSLNAIFNGLDYSKREKKENLKLEDWVNQNVLLLNSSLTVEKNNIGSDVHIWAIAMYELISDIDKHFKLPFILLGKHSTELLAKTIVNNKVITEKHPSYYARQNKSFPDKVFKLANQELIKMKKNAIIW